MMKSLKRLPVSRLLALTLLGAAPLSALACNDESYIGTVCTFAFNYCPKGYLPADGRLVSLQQNVALYSLLGTTYGGDAKTTFGLPDLRGRSAVGIGVSDYGTSTVLGQKGGSATATLSAASVPAHIHPATGSLAAGAIIDGPLSLPVTGGTVSGQTVNGSVTVNALNGATAPTSGLPVPTNSANSVGKVGTGQVAFYPQGSTPVAVPSSHNLTVSGGSISGANASATVRLPATQVPVQVTVGANTTSQQPVPTVSPNLGMTVCIMANGLYPPRP